MATNDGCSQEQQQNYTNPDTSGAVSYKQNLADQFEQSVTVQQQQPQSIQQPYDQAVHNQLSNMVAGNQQIQDLAQRSQQILNSNLAQSNQLPFGPVLYFVQPQYGQLQNISSQFSQPQTRMLRLNLSQPQPPILPPDFSQPPPPIIPPDFSQISAQVSQPQSNQQYNPQQFYQQRFTPQQSYQEPYNPRQSNQQRYTPQQSNQQRYNQQRYNPQRSDKQLYDPKQPDQQRYNPQQSNQQRYNQREFNWQQYNPQRSNQRQYDPQQSDQSLSSSPPFGVSAQGNLTRSSTQPQQSQPQAQQSQPQPQQSQLPPSAEARMSDSSRCKSCFRQNLTDEQMCMQLNLPCHKNKEVRHLCCRCVYLITASGYNRNDGKLVCPYDDCEQTHDVPYAVQDACGDVARKNEPKQRYRH